jgi:hypothetical protein
MKHDFEYRGVRISLSQIDEMPARWRWLLHPLKAFGSINRVEGGQVVGTLADAQALARKAVDVNAKS